METSLLNLLSWVEEMIEKQESQKMSDQIRLQILTKIQAKIKSEIGRANGGKLYLVNRSRQLKVLSGPFQNIDEAKFALKVRKQALPEEKCGVATITLTTKG